MKDYGYLPPPRGKPPNYVTVFEVANPDMSTPCVYVNGNPLGTYPVRRIDGELVMVRRLVYAQERFPVQPGFRVMAVCGMRDCVSPDHMRLELVGTYVPYADIEKGMEMRGATVKVQDAKRNGFVMGGGGLTLGEYTFLRGWFSKYDLPFTVAYPRTRAVAVYLNDLPITNADLAELRSIAILSGSLKATVAVTPEGVRIGYLTPKAVPAVARGITAYLFDRYSVTWPVVESDPMEAAYGAAEALLAEPTPAVPIEDHFAAFVAENPMPAKGLPAQTLCDGFNAYLAAQAPDATPISSKALATILQDAGFTKKRESQGIKWMAASLEAS